MTALVHDSAQACWLCFDKPIEVVQAFDVEEVLPGLRRVEEFANRNNLYALGFVSYEAAPAFDSALHVRSTESWFPLLWFGLYEKPEPFRLPSPVSSLQLAWQPTISREEYNASIERIKEYIAEGDTYQVNYSFRLRAPFRGDARGFFLQLANAQPSNNGAFIETDDFAICSASPELFFSLDGENIVTRPMKGTAPRGLTVSADKANAEKLQTSEKNRAENLMIVDMMRNDLGRIAEVGSVHVRSLFDVERYPTVWQMTSTVAAKTDASVTEIMKALFPCASITGAPKARTMEIIAELESTRRKIYTGAIGFIAPNRKAQFNVAIRTVLVNKKKDEAEYGVGGGIVWASTTEEEYNECLTKARVLTEVRPKFELFETMLFTQQDGFFLFDEHLARLKSSAEYFDFPLDEQMLKRMIAQLHNDLPRLKSDFRVRLVVHSDGLPTFAIRGIDSSDTPVRLRLAKTPIDSNNVFLYHKTTHRKVYDDALASVSDCDDVVLWNERGEVTESTIANVVVEIGSELFTPPVECGLLAGVFRSQLLKEGRFKERMITIDELKRSSHVFLVNSVRMWREARLLEQE